jgi:hypothetical protein
VYPADQLTRLAGRKAVLRRHIARHRDTCVQAATRVVQPLAWLDRMLAHWRQLSPLVPLAALPLGFLLKRSASPRPRLLGTLLRWGPLAIRALRGFAGIRRE